MIKQDNLHFDAQKKLQAGITKVARAVGSTMGTGGNNALIEAIESPGHLATNDGWSIASAVYLADPIENMGRNVLLESISRANKASGDGSSTTCVLTAAIIEEGLKHTEHHHPMDIKRSLEECLPLVERALDKQTKDITVDDVGKVATISAEDAGIGAMIQEIYSKIGKDGLVYWDISKTAEDTYTVGSGITIEGAGYYSPYMCDVSDSGQTTNQIRIKDAHLLITKQKIASANDFGVLAENLHNNNVHDLVVFCDDIEPLVVPDLLKTRLARGFRIVLVKMPVLWREWWYEDLAKASGATVIDPAAGLTVKQATKDHLGHVDNLVVTKDDTFIDGIKDVSDYVKELEAEGSDDSKLRASRLNTKTARYYVGAHSDSALSYRRLKVEDAISASYQALNGGVLPGGGVALRTVAGAMPLTIGGLILKDALCAPEHQIQENAGIYTEDHLKEGSGFDTRTKEVVNMMKAGIMDPKNVVYNAVKNAISVAGTVLTAPTVVLLPRDEAPQQQLPPVVR